MKIKNQSYQILVPPPTLTISRSGGTRIFAWPASDYHFRLQSTANLNGGTWSDVAATVMLINGLEQAVISQPSGMQFFRLAP